ncbi:T9SS type A sorting domain-containing protein, partial [Lentimicrobium sp.]|uniref:T9SS type A sorting domain-containing protein n=1 Tax=Lentimicrobium sp. TaxID=2034841 RepID=UPI002BCBB7A2
RKMKTSHILLLCSLFTLHCSLMAQQVIYVDVSNNTGIEDGTMAHPFNTIPEGLQLSQNGDSISVLSGTYTEDPILIEKCVSIAGESRISTMVEGTFILSSKLGTLPVLISNLWCRNVMHSDSGYSETPLIIEDCGLQILNDHTASVGETGRILLKNCVVTDSIHIQSAACAAKREVINCETEGGLWVSSSSSQGTIRVVSNQIGVSMRVSTISKSDTVFIADNTISDSLLVLSTASDPDVISGNTIGKGVRLKAVAHSGLLFMENHVQNGSLSARYTALDESIIGNNNFNDGGIRFQATAGDIVIRENEIHTDGSVAAIRFSTTAGGYFEDNTITLPYFEPSGLPFENDTLSVCAINVHSTSFGGMRGNRISGGAYGVYLSAIAANDFDLNEIKDSHIGLYLKSVSAYADSNRVEYCIGDGMILDYQPEYADTNAIRLNYNIVRSNGGHGIRTRGNCPMGKSDEPATGFNIIKDNGGYDLYIETLTSFVDTIWAQNNEWSHSTEAEIGQYDIYDANDDPARALVMYMPLLSFGVSEHPLPEIRLSPNPTRGYVSLRFSAGCRQPVVLEIVDLYGKVLEVQVLEPGNSGTLDLDMGHLPSGMYFVRLYFDNQMIVKKIVKL